jgi:hypothetical protein
MRCRGRLYIRKRQAFFNPKCFRLTRARAADNGFWRKLFTVLLLAKIHRLFQCRLPRQGWQ